MRAQPLGEARGLPAARRYFGTVGDESGGWGGQPLTRRVYHQDMLGSTALVTDETGTPAVPPAGAGSVAYTAFGELLCGRGGEPPGAGDPEGCEVGSPGGTAPEGFPRYQYAGGWGYESGGFSADPAGPGWEPGAGCCAPPCPSHLLALHGVNPRLAPIRLLHVGWRWYQPDIGRFIQRDPIGIYGGMNLYVYQSDGPLEWVDPTGLTSEVPILPGTEGLPRLPNGWIRMPPGTRPKFIPGRGWIAVPRTPVPPVPPGGPSLGAAGTVAAVCVVFAGAYGVGTAIDHAPRLFGKDRISGYIGRWIYRRFWPKPKGLRFTPGGGMIL